MTKSFFERLTGSVRLGEGEPPREQDEPAASIQRLPKTKRRQRRAEAAAETYVSEAGGSAFPAAVETAPPDEEGQLTVDIYDDGQHIVIQASVAGVKPDDLDISLQEDTLTIRGLRRRTHEGSDENFFYQELFWGTFSRSIILPEEVDFSKAEATVKNGLLTVKLPKKDRGEKKLAVKVG